MHITLVTNTKIPVFKYGGVQRIVVWLSDELVKLGHQVSIIAPKGSRSESSELIPFSDKSAIKKLIPQNTDIVCDFGFLLKDEQVAKPVMFICQWVHSSKYVFPPNTVFVSRAHAKRFHHKHFIYNSVDPNEFIYREKKDDYFLFLSKVSRSSKGVDVAIKLAKKLKFKLIIAGGWKFTFSRNIKSVGEVGGQRKAELLAGARALLFPISWGEPFGIVTTEALVSGTPVITTPFGAMPEIVTPDVGFICNDLDEMQRAVEAVHTISPKACRDRVLNNFTAEVMTQNYLKYFNQILEKGRLD